MTSLRPQYIATPCRQETFIPGIVSILPWPLVSLQSEFVSENDGLSDLVPQALQIFLLIRADD